MKYIDADKLKAEINGIIKAITTNGHPDVSGTETECMVAAENEALNLVLETIDALQQDDFPTTNEQVKEFLAAHPKIKVPEKYKNPDWLFKKQEQPSSSDLDEAAEEFGKRQGLELKPLAKKYFKAGAEYQYQKDRYEFSKLKAKEWCNGYDAALSRFVKISYEARDWFSSKDGDFICGASFGEAIPVDVELYYKKKQ